MLCGRGCNFSMAILLGVLLLALAGSYTLGLPLTLDAIDQETILDLSERDVNNTSYFERACRTKTLCPEGIANIVVGGIMFGLLGCFACVMWQWEVQGDRKARIRMALARNREIDRQMEAAKLSQQQQQTPLPPPPLYEESITTGGGPSGKEDKTALLGGADSIATSQKMTPPI